MIDGENSDVGPGPRDETHSSIDPQSGQLLDPGAHRTYLDSLNTPEEPATPSAEDPPEADEPLADHWKPNP